MPSNELTSVDIINTLLFEGKVARLALSASSLRRKRHESAMSIVMGSD
jgi:hypothetical protein